MVLFTHYSIVSYIDVLCFCRIGKALQIHSIVTKVIYLFLVRIRKSVVITRTLDISSLNLLLRGTKVKFTVFKKTESRSASQITMIYSFFTFISLASMESAKGQLKD